MQGDSKKAQLARAEPYGVWNPLSIFNLVTCLCMVVYYSFLWMGASGFFFNTATWYFWLGGAMGLVALTNFILCVVYSTCDRASISGGRNVYAASFYSGYCSGAAMLLTIPAFQVSAFVILYNTYGDKLDPSDFASPSCDALCQFFNSSRAHSTYMVAIYATLATIPMVAYSLVNLSSSAAERPVTREFLEAVDSGELNQQQVTSGVRRYDGDMRQAPGGNGTWPHANYRRVSPSGNDIDDDDRR